MSIAGIADYISYRENIDGLEERPMYIRNPEFTKFERYQCSKETATKISNFILTNFPGTTTIWENGCLSVFKISDL